MVDEKSARRCFSRFFDNFECRSRNSIGCADNPNPLAQVFRHYGDETVYREDGPDYFDRRSRDRVVRRHLRHLEQLGYRVTLEPAA